jgi:UPF0755 protein
MNKRLRNFLLIWGAAAATAGVWALGKYQLWTAPVGQAENWCIEIEPGMNAADALEASHPEVASVIDWRGWSIYPGKYCAVGIQQANEVARRIATGQREEIRLPLPSKRTLAEIAGHLAPRIWADSAAIMEALDTDSMLWQIIPNTYRVYWECDANQLADRLRSESRNWWTADRLKQAWSLGLTQREVVTLASIVQEETATVEEAPRVAGLYLNRLKKKMLLQADPTLKFALGDWTIRRLLDEDKKIASPYNTYRNPGLPPGPIRIPEPTYLEAVLQAEQHNYLYMCAKPDGSGTHAFARNYAQHLRNAREYQTMLNRQRIYR